MLQEQGAVAVSIFSSAFEQVLERHLTHWELSDNFPRVIVDHPIQNISTAERSQRAAHITAALLRFLPEE